jgi:hypothetical protein
MNFTPYAFLGRFAGTHKNLRNSLDTLVSPEELPFKAALWQQLLDLGIKMYLLHPCEACNFLAGMQSQEE